MPRSDRHTGQSKTKATGMLTAGTKGAPLPECIAACKCTQVPQGADARRAALQVDHHDTFAHSSAVPALAHLGVSWALLSKSMPSCACTQLYTCAVLAECVRRTCALLRRCSLDSHATSCAPSRTCTQRPRRTRVQHKGRVCGPPVLSFARCPLTCTTSCTSAHPGVRLSCVCGPPARSSAAAPSAGRRLRRTRGGRPARPSPASARQAGTAPAWILQGHGVA